MEMKMQWFFQLYVIKVLFWLIDALMFKVTLDKCFYTIWNNFNILEFCIKDI